jgi:hypothetical protein
MKNRFLRFIFITAIMSFFPITSFGQCSDAGVCQIGHIISDNKENQLDISLLYKNGYSGKDNDVSFSSFQLAAQYRLFGSSTIGFVMPYNLQSGPGGDVNGPGDLLISWSQGLLLNGTNALSASIGVKLATGDENKEPTLPQIYQPGLGSNDFLFAVNYNYEKFGLGIGYQLSGGRNDNEILRLKRGDDLLIRASYLFTLDYFQITPNLIFIKQLSTSSILDPGSENENFIEIEGSDQSQLNFLTIIQYNLNEDYALFSEIAIPFLKRDVNVDGLKRAYTASFGIKLSIEN